MPLQKKRLLKLADFLDKLKPKQLRMSAFVSNIGDKLGDCDTVACAAGWACTIPSFNKAGFQIDTFYSDRPTYRDANGERLCGFEAIESFFGLSERAAVNIFGGEYLADKKTTPKQVAKRIRKLVAQHS